MDFIGLSFVECCVEADIDQRDTLDNPVRAEFSFLILNTISAACTLALRIARSKDSPMDID
ncbi:hypothetical protein, partial [uncultured Sulfitobacter sp.]|uniref:hypothetical protein n=1 Tax=uncultured Sulfitobacter sp. TaxID=191468 RepID=UPI0032B1ADA1